METLRQKEFNKAMELYNKTPYYKIFNFFVSCLIIFLQIFLVYKTFQFSIGILWQVIVLFMAYFITDLVNGLTHLYMDHNENYNWIGGPLVAKFHLHHKIQLYTNRPLLIIYFNETGAKVWLVGYLIILEMVSSTLSPFWLFCFTYIGVLSSVAEVSHYLCHNSHSPVVSFLSKARLLLSREHHANHHVKDNTHYAFLNGISDPIINVIAKLFYKGYKKNTDLHFALYLPPDEF